MESTSNDIGESASPSQFSPPTSPPLAPTSVQPTAQPSVQPITNVVTSQQKVPTSSGRAAVGVVGNIIWLLFAGVWLMLGYLIAGVLACLTIVGIPFGIQAFKLAGYSLWPFNRVVVRDAQRDVGLSTLGNVLWFLVGGWWLAIAHVVFAFFLAITIIGAPLALASLKMAGLALAPFGKKIVSRSSLGSMTSVTVVSSIG